MWLWGRTLRRRGNKRKTTWSQAYRLAARWLPVPRILHPYPDQRLSVTTHGRSPVRQFCTPGSVRGAPRKGCPYRDSTDSEKTETRVHELHELHEGEAQKLGFLPFPDSCDSCNSWTSPGRFFQSVSSAKSADTSFCFLAVLLSSPFCFPNPCNPCNLAKPDKSVDTLSASSRVLLHATLSRPHPCLVACGKRLVALARRR